MISYRRANRQYLPMTEEEVWRYLESRQGAMFVAFVREDGYPHLTPVWFVAVDRKLYFSGKSYKAKMRLADSAKVCCSWEDGFRYTELRGVALWGRSRVVDDPAVIERVKALLKAKNAGRAYEQSEVPGDWARERRSESTTIVEIQPERVSSWDNRKLRS